MRFEYKWFENFLDINCDFYGYVMVFFFNFSLVLGIE